MGKYKIYKITNIINNKIYIGKTNKTIQKRFETHIKNANKKINRYLYDAINKYGSGSFIIEQIDTSDDNKEANEKEISHILKLESNNKDIGYNMTIGGDGGNTGKYHYGKSPYDWWVEKYGKEKADEIKKQVYSNISKKLKIFYKEKSWEDRYGEKSEEIKKKISITNKEKKIKPPIQYWIDKPHPMLNRNHSDDAKIKLSKYRKGKSYEDLFGEEKAKDIKKKRTLMWLGIKNPNYVDNLNRIEIIEFLNFLVENKTMKYCSMKLNKSEYKLRIFLREIGIKNIQNLKRHDKENIQLKKIINNYE